MGIQLVLIFGVLTSLWVALRASAGSHRILRVVGGLIVVFATTLSVLNPDLWQRFARWLGVGRGADLVLYLLVPAFLVSTAQTLARIRRLERKHDELVRRLAVRSATDILTSERHPKE